jgi:hypothetical protein
MTADFALKLVASTVALIHAALSLWASLRKRVDVVRKTRNLGDPGRLYIWMYALPLSVATFLLAIVILASFVSLCVGAVISTSAPATMQTFASVRIWPALVSVFEYSIWLAVLYFGIAILIQFRVVSRTLLFLTQLLSPGVRSNKGWINAKLQVEHGDDAVALVPNMEACHLVADAALKMYMQNGDYGSDRAETPRELSLDEMANVLLIGNAIEGKLHDLNQARISFKDFYALLASAARQESRPFAQTALKAVVANPAASLYRQLREYEQVSNRDRVTPGLLPDSADVDKTVQSIVGRLVNDYDGNAYNLAVLKIWGKEISLPWIGRYSCSRVYGRLFGFERFNLPGHGAMRRQVVKIGRRWKVWPEIVPTLGEESFSKGIALLYLNLGCIVTFPTTKEIPNDEHFRRLVPSVTLDIAALVQELVQSSNDPRVNAWCQAKFNCDHDKVTRWDLEAEVDYFLWQQSRQGANSVFGEASTASWRIVDGNSFSRT